MKGTCASFLALALLALGTPLAEGSSPDSLPQNPHFSPGKPVTDASVEAGLRQLRESLRRSPEFSARDVSTHLKFAEFLSQQGDPNGAIEEYQAALQLDSSLAQAHRGLGAVYLDKHEWKLAQASLQKSAHLAPHHSQTFFWLGRAYLAQQHFSSATSAFLRAIQLSPTDAIIYSDLGLGYMAQGFSHEAAQALSQAIRLQPDLAEAHDRFEQLQLENNDPQRLIQATHRILDRMFRRE